jgi:trans-aconitate methyltransferase
MTAEEFEMRVNSVLAAERVKYRLVAGRWLPTGASDAEVLRQVLLRGEEDVAGCRQGDQQVEMVVSTVQALLARPNAVLVDYGAGLGRVLAGLAEASRFQTAEYVAVDEPVPPEVVALAGSAGASSRCVTRSEFLQTPLAADVIMVVNTLHHIPFADIPAQLERLLGCLKPGGVLLIHEMGELREPEQHNVPWRSEDLHLLFAGGAFSINARSTVSRSGVPLAHVLVELVDAAKCREALNENVGRVWTQMKARTLDDIRALYEARREDEHVALQHALIINANLDLNRAK